jgi:hypothetical protein
MKIKEFNSRLINNKDIKTLNLVPIKNFRKSETYIIPLNLDIVDLQKTNGYQVANIEFSKNGMQHVLHIKAKIGDEIITKKSFKRGMPKVLNEMMINLENKINKIN